MSARVTAGTGTGTGTAAAAAAVHVRHYFLPDKLHPMFANSPFYVTARVVIFSGNRRMYQTAVVVGCGPECARAFVLVETVGVCLVFAKKKRRCTLWLCARNNYCTYMYKVVNRPFSHLPGHSPALASSALTPQPAEVPKQARAHGLSAEVQRAGGEKGRQHGSPTENGPSIPTKALGTPTTTTTSATTVARRGLGPFCDIAHHHRKRKRRGGAVREIIADSWRDGGSGPAPTTGSTTATSRERVDDDRRGDRTSCRRRCRRRRARGRQKTRVGGRGGGWCRKPWKRLSEIGSGGSGRGRHHHHHSNGATGNGGCCRHRRRRSERELN